MNRAQFTFYRSYYDAIRDLPKKDQTAVLLAICAYALDNEEPKLSGTANAIFTLVRPTLDAGRRKAMGGHRGSPKKDDEKIDERCGEDTAKEKEGEVEKEGEIEVEKEIENECYKENEKETAAEPPAPPRQNIDYEAIKDLYNTVCVSFPRCTSLSEARKKAIKARFANGYTVEDFRALFTKAEASSFLKGKNDRNWTANFDWLLKDANMAKVLDGNYDNKDASGAPIRREEPPEWMARYIKPKTAGEDPAIKARADALKAQLKGE